MKNFAKIIQLDDEHDVLFYKDFDNSEDEHPYQVAMQSQWDGMSVTMRLGYVSEQKRDEQFEKAGLEAARFHIDSIRKQISEVLDGADSE